MHKYLIFFIMASALQAGIKTRTSPALDGWSILNAAEGGAYYAGLRIAGVSSERSFYISAGIGIAMELWVDGYQNKMLWFRPDPNGWDPADIAWQIFGSGMATLVEMAFRINAQVRASKKEILVTVNIPL